MPAGCGLGQIKSLIHEGGWRDERGDGKAEQRKHRKGKKNRMGLERSGSERKDEGVSEGEDRKGG